MGSIQIEAETEDEAAKLAGDLTALNQSRKALTEEGKEAAIRIVEETEIGQDRVLVIYLPDCHESLAGIIAGRIREKYNKPVFVLTKGETMVKGSGRSIESYSMFEELVKCGDLMEQYGGHPMAAGLSIIQKSNYTINEICPKTLKSETLYYIFYYFFEGIYYLFLCYSANYFVRLANPQIRAPNCLVRLVNYTVR